MMKIRILINVFWIFTLYSILITANAGSSATTITTVTANIVPAVSFSVTQPIMLTQQASNNLPGTSAGNEGNTSLSNNIILRSTNIKHTTKFRVKSSQKLAYDVSVPEHVSVSDYNSKITANITYKPHAQEQLNINEEHVLDIGGVLIDAIEHNRGAYHGLIDITVNYN